MKAGLLALALLAGGQEGKFAQIALEGGPEAELATRMALCKGAQPRRFPPLPLAPAVEALMRAVDLVEDGDKWAALDCVLEIPWYSRCLATEFMTDKQERLLWEPGYIVALIDDDGPADERRDSPGEVLDDLLRRKSEGTERYLEAMDRSLIPHLPELWCYWEG